MIESFFRMKSTAKQEHNLNFKRYSYIPKMCVDPCPVGSTTAATKREFASNTVLSPGLPGFNAHKRANGLP